MAPVTRSKTIRKNVVRPNSRDNTPIPRVGVKGFFLRANSIKGVKLPCPIADDSTAEYPSMDVDGAFDIGAGVPIHRAQVELGNLTFLAYGYVDGNARANRSMETIRDRPFTGEVLLFQTGVRVHLLSQPRAPKSTINKAVVAFANRLEFAYARKRMVEDIISVSKLAISLNVSHALRLPVMSGRPRLNSIAAMPLANSEAPSGPEVALRDLHFEKLNLGDEVNAQYHSASSAPTSEDEDLPRDRYVLENGKPGRQRKKFTIPNEEGPKPSRQTPDVKKSAGHAAPARAPPPPNSVQPPPQASVHVPQTARASSPPAPQAGVGHNNQVPPAGRAAGQNQGQVPFPSPQPQAPASGSAAQPEQANYAAHQQSAGVPPPTSPQYHSTPPQTPKAVPQPPFSPPLNYADQQQTASPGVPHPTSPQYHPVIRTSVCDSSPPPPGQMPQAVPQPPFSPPFNYADQQQTASPGVPHPTSPQYHPVIRTSVCDSSTPPHAGGQTPQQPPLSAPFNSPAQPAGIHTQSVHTQPVPADVPRPNSNPMPTPSASTRRASSRRGTSATQITEDSEDDNNDGIWFAGFNPLREVPNDSQTLKTFRYQKSHKSPLNATMAWYASKSADFLLNPPTFVDEPLATGDVYLHLVSGLPADTSPSHKRLVWVWTTEGKWRNVTASVRAQNFSMNLSDVLGKRFLRVDEKGIYWLKQAP
ncbi:hypothetical protein H0H93_006597 [Arthromyces matolae]|nr:hypothetical protein H0H93_006597 [Arthromyces matolae]